MSPLAALLAALLGAAPFTAEQPQVKEGVARLRRGDALGALQALDEAEKAVGPHPEIDYDRGHALLALGRHAEAREAWKRALEADRAGALSSRALQNMGNALDALGDHEGAARAFGQALTRDPGNEDARYNLEVLLRRRGGGKGAPKDQGDQGTSQPQGRPPQEASQQPKAGQQDQQGQGDRQGQAPEPAPRPGEQQQGKQGAKPEPKPGEPKPGKDEQARDGSGQAGGQRRTGETGEARPQGLGKQDAERLLDAMRARERNMPLGPAGRREARRKDVEKDW